MTRCTTVAARHARAGTHKGFTMSNDTRRTATALDATLVAELRLAHRHLARRDAAGEPATTIGTGAWARLLLRVIAALEARQTKAAA